MLMLLLGLLMLFLLVLLLRLLLLLVLLPFPLVFAPLANVRHGEAGGEMWPHLGNIEKGESGEGRRKVV